MDSNATKVTIPRKSYQLRVIEAEKGVSAVRTDDKGNKKGGNPNITLKLEIINAAPVPYKDPATGEISMVDINGLTVTSWVTLTENALRFANEANNALGLPILNPSNMHEAEANAYLGQTGYAILEGKPRVVTDSEGNPIVNPNTQQTVTVPEIRHVMWLGR